MVNGRESISVLHIDDEPDFAQLVAEFLEREDERFQVDTALNADMGHDRMADVGYDCIVSDYDMPGQNGIEFLKAVRQKYPDLPFILYTGKGSEEVASEAISEGVTEYIQKESGTSQYTVLANRIKNAVSQYRAQIELADREHRLDLFFEQSPLGVIQWDDEFNFARVNDMAREILGYDEGELVGQPWEVVIQEADRDEIGQVVVADLLADEGGYHSINENVRKDGERITCEWHNWVVTDEDEEVIAVFSQFEDITERQEREHGLRYERDRFQAVFEESFDAMVIADDAGQFIDANESATTLFGMPEEELLGRSIGEFAPEEFDFDAAWSEFQQSGNERGTFPLVRPDGTKRYVEYAATMNVVPGQHLSILRDITERKEREQELQNRTKQLQDIIDTVEGAMWIRNKEGEYEFMNQYHRDLFDIADDVEVAGKQFSDLLPTDVSEQFLENDRRVYETQEPVEIEETVETDDGPRDFLTRIVPLVEDGAVYATCGFATDITERVEREQALEESEERYRKLLGTAPTPILIYNESEEVVYANHEAVELFEADDEEALLGLTPQDFIHPDNQDELDSRRHRLIEDKQAVPANELTILDLNGREKTVLVASSPIRYEGQPAIQTVATNITELKDRERQLQRYETLVEVSGDPMYMLDTGGHLEYVNQALVEKVGFEEGDLLGEHVSKVMVDDHVERGEELVQSLLAIGDRRGTFEMEAITKSGERIPAEAHIALLFRDGAFSGTVGVLRDITDRLERERRLQRERDRLDEFASVVSHDLRNPMNVAQGRLDLAMKEYESEDLAAVERALDRMERLIEDVLFLARAGESVGETESVQLSNLVEACWRNVETDAAELNVETDATILADETRLQQLLENVIRNAVEHGGSTVAVTVGDVPDGFFIEDDGPGIPDDERREVLESGYSTKEEGTGFGLSIVRDIVQAHNWQIRLGESSTGGARFEITGVSTP